MASFEVQKHRHPAEESKQKVTINKRVTQEVVFKLSCQAAEWLCYAAATAQTSDINQILLILFKICSVLHLFAPSCLNLCSFAHTLASPADPLMPLR